jgi:hypothetical protein
MRIGIAFAIVGLTVVTEGWFIFAIVNHQGGGWGDDPLLTFL